VEFQLYGREYSLYNRPLCVCGNVAEGRKYFRDFLRTEFSEENVLFWLACEELKRETNAELIEEKARSIYEDYISILSPKEVGLRRFSLVHILWFSFAPKIGQNPRGFVKFGMISFAVKISANKAKNS